VIVNEFRTAGLTATAAKASSLLGQCQVAKPQTRIAELPFSAINLRHWQPDDATVNNSFRLIGTLRSPFNADPTEPEFRGFIGSPIVPTDLEASRGVLFAFSRKPRSRPKPISISRPALSM
jgi:hypothetical protein